MCLSKMSSCGDRVAVGSILLGLGLFGGGVVAGIAGWNSLCVGMILSGIGVGVAGKCIGSACRLSPTESPKVTSLLLI